MEVFKREVELSTKVQLQTVPQWLIHKDQLRERQDLGNKKGSIIIIIVVSNAELYISAPKD